MISPSTPAALAGIVVGAGPSTRTVVAAGHRPGVLRVPVSTNHDPPSKAIGVAGILASPRRLSLAYGRLGPGANTSTPQLSASEASPSPGHRRIGSKSGSKSGTGRVCVVSRVRSRRQR